ncbi:MAG: response regulator transcription factor [Muribaculaceae bacterium]|nr:response regulator transcription factor [Muribaculaceae bacterium]
MIRCLVIDDEPLARKQIAAYADKVPYLDLTASCASALEAQKILDEQTIDAIFIDINMPDLNGLDFVRSLAQPPLVVFTTAYSQYAVEGYKVDAVDYLLKPFGADDFARAAEKVKRRYDAERTPTAMSQPDADDAIFLKTDYKIVRVALAEIRYIEAMSEYLRIYSDALPRPIVVLLSMKKMEETLPHDTFMRIHRSYIINLHKIIEVNRNHVLMGQDASLPVGDLYKDTFNAYIASKFVTR